MDSPKPYASQRWKRKRLGTYCGDMDDLPVDRTADGTAVSDTQMRQLVFDQTQKQNLTRFLEDQASKARKRQESLLRMSEKYSRLEKLSTKNRNSSCEQYISESREPAAGASSGSLLLSLPPELRNHILGLVLVHDRPLMLKPYALKEPGLLFVANKHVKKAYRSSTEKINSDACVRLSRN